MSDNTNTQDRTYPDNHSEGGNGLKELPELHRVTDAVKVDLNKYIKRFKKELAEKYSLKGQQRFKIYLTLLDEDQQVLITAITTKNDGSLTKEDYYKLMAETHAG